MGDESVKEKCWATTSGCHDLRPLFETCECHNAMHADATLIASPPSLSLSLSLAVVAFCARGQKSPKALAADWSRKERKMTKTML